MYIWGQLRFPQEFPSVLALSSLIIGASFLVVFLGQWINRGVTFTSGPEENHEP